MVDTPNPLEFVGTATLIKELRVRGPDDDEKDTIS